MSRKNTGPKQVNYTPVEMITGRKKKMEVMRNSSLNQSGLNLGGDVNTMT